MEDQNQQALELARIVGGYSVACFETLMCLTGRVVSVEVLDGGLRKIEMLSRRN